CTISEVVMISLMFMTRKATPPVKHWRVPSKRKIPMASHTTAYGMPEENVLPFSGRLPCRTAFRARTSAMFGTANKSRPCTRRSCTQIIDSGWKCRVHGMRNPDSYESRASSIRRHGAAARPGAGDDAGSDQTLTHPFSSFLLKNAFRRHVPPCLGRRSQDGLPYSGCSHEPLA